MTNTNWDKKAAKYKAKAKRIFKNGRWLINSYEVAFVLGEDIKLVQIRAQAGEYAIAERWGRPYWFEEAYIHNLGEAKKNEHR